MININRTKNEKLNELMSQPIKWPNFNDKYRKIKFTTDACDIKDRAIITDAIDATTGEKTVKSGSFLKYINHESYKDKIVDDTDEDDISTITEKFTKIIKEMVDMTVRIPFNTTAEFVQYYWDSERGELHMVLEYSGDPYDDYYVAYYYPTSKLEADYIVDQLLYYEVTLKGEIINGRHIVKEIL